MHVGHLHDDIILMLLPKCCLWKKSQINLHYSFRFECSAWLMLLCVLKYVYCERKVSGGQVVIKSRGPGISPGYHECGPRLLLFESIRKIEPKETPSCLIPCLLVVFTQQHKILVTTLVWGCV